LSQTPSPLQEWQYSSGIVLYKLFKSDVPEWQIETGLAEDSRPLYTGSNDYRQLTGPVIDVRYKDIAFASIGEGLGVNLLRGDNYRAGVALGYDMGREAHNDLTQLKGLGNISSAPVFKDVWLLMPFPRRFPWCSTWMFGNTSAERMGLSAISPFTRRCPGSSEKLVMFAGPSITLATRLHMQTEFGVSATQSIPSGVIALFGERAEIRAFLEVFRRPG
jgi:hypothetical protein